MMNFTYEYVVKGVRKGYLDILKNSSIRFASQEEARSPNKTVWDEMMDDLVTPLKILFIHKRSTKQFGEKRSRTPSTLPSASCTLPRRGRSVSA